MLYKIQTTAKAWAAAIGSLVTALLALAAPDTRLFTYLTIASAICTAVGTWAIPNAPAVEENADVPDGLS